MSFFSVTIAIIIILLTVLITYFRIVYYWKKRGVNGPVPLPIVGNFLENLAIPAKEIEEQRLLKYGPVYETFEFWIPILTIADPTLIREIAIKHFYNFQNRYNRFPGDRFLCKTVFFTKDDAWKTLRSDLSPLFTRRKITAMIPYVNECVVNTIQYIHSIGDKEVVLKKMMASFTSDVLAKCIFGVTTNGFNAPNNEFLVNAPQSAELSFWHIFVSLITPKWISKLYEPLQYLFVNRQTWNYLKNIIHLIINQRKIAKVQNNDVINLILDANEDKETNSFDFDINETQTISDHNKNFQKNKKKMDDEDILAQALIFFIAGNDATSTMLNFVLYSLAMNPEIQEKLYNEIVTYFGERQMLDFHDINSIQYLNAVINESLRMYPPILFFDRVAAEEIVLNESIKIEKGTVINLPVYAIQHDPQFFPEPHEFKPERFLPENKHLIVPYTFFPFGIGPRNCFGMRFALITAKIFLIKLLKQFKVQKTKNTPKLPNYAVVFRGLDSELFATFAARGE